MKVIDLNVAFEVTPDNPRIRFGTGLKEWSAPETRNQQYTDFKIDSWSLGCVLYCDEKEATNEHSPGRAGFGTSLPNYDSVEDMTKGLRKAMIKDIRTISKCTY